MQNRKIKMQKEWLSCKKLSETKTLYLNTPRNHDFIISPGQGIPEQVMDGILLNLIPP